MKVKGEMSAPKSSSVMVKTVPPPTERATLAVILRPHGLRGDLVTHLLTDFPERFEGLQEVWLTHKDGRTEPAELESHWFHKGALVLKFTGINSRTKAEPFVGCKVQIPLSERVALETDEFYIDTLIGCRVELTDGTSVGEVVDVARMAGGELLVVQNRDDQSDKSGREHLIPFVQTICVQVDPISRLIRITPPEGLLEIEN